MHLFLFRFTVVLINNAYFFLQVAKKMLKSNENLIFGKIDGTANDIPYMFPPLKGFPTIFFLSAYEKFDPIQYQGDRSYKYVACNIC